MAKKIKTFYNEIKFPGISGKEGGALMDIILTERV